jgi:hypothetical protein
MRSGCKATPLALITALVALCSGFMSPVPRARRFQLEAAPPDGVRRFISPLKNLSLDGDKPTSWETVTRTGTFYDRRYGDFEITRPMLLAMVKNFDEQVYGQQIFIDVSHEPSNGAAAKVLKLAVEDNKLRALLEWTPYGVDAVRNRGFIYLSADYHENWQDNEKRAQHGPVLLGAGLTIRPCIKHLDPIQLSEEGAGRTYAGPILAHPEFTRKLLQETHTMWKQLLEALKAKLGSFKLADAVVLSLITAAEAAVGKVTDETAAKALMTSFETAGKQLAEQIGDKPITLSIHVPELKTGLTADDVKKLMEDQATATAAATKQLTEKLEGKVKLLGDTIAAAQGLDDGMKKELTDSVKDLVTADMTDEQVKKLAAAQIASGNRIVAAGTLAGMGFQIAGTTHISVDSSNEVKALQEQVDKRIYEKMPAFRRYALSEGVQVAANKDIVEQSLALFDAQNGRRLHEEYRRHKQLAGGDSLVSDVAVPAIFERTVIREALYQLVGLGLCDVGTSAFGAVAQIPYSYRDTTAAGASSTRKYEGQPIARAAVKQAMEDFRPIPQKLAFEVSDELRYLTANGQLDWDSVAENARNASRIIAEDTEQLVFDEHLNVSDQFAVTAVVTEATAAGDGAKKIFCLDNFPVLRPKKIYDLQGNQVGATLYPIVITVNAVAIAEWAPGVGAGTYWVMNYNLGEVTFVNQAGVPVAITNTHAIVCSYSYTSNVYKFDTDLPANTKADEHYDGALYRFGLRKVAIEDRSYMPNVGVMSGTLRTQLEQARQFGANFKRQGSDLMTDGNLGRIKDVPCFRSFAPGLAIGDQRIVICERGTVRFRMAKPWTMNQLENQKDANGRFTGKKEAYGDQFIVVATPTQLKGAFTSMVFYSATARVDRAA